MAISLMLCFQSQAFAAKAVCTVKNIQTGQVYKAIKGKRSYSIAQKAAMKLAAMGCIANAKDIKYCKLSACYQQ